MRETIIETWQSLNAALRDGTVLHDKIIPSVVVIFLVVGLRYALVKLVINRMEDQRAQYRWKKATSYAFSVLVVLLVGHFWSDAVGSLATFAGLLSAGLAIALRDVVVNVVAWAYILWQHPFRVGDRIEIGETSGDVIDIGVMQFALIETRNWVKADQSTGRIIHVPNGRIFTHSTMNYTEGFNYIWDELRVPVTFESDWRAAKALLTNIVNEHAEHVAIPAERDFRRASGNYLMMYSKLTPIVYTSIEQNGVILTMRFLTEPRKRRTLQETMWEAVLDAFGQRPDISFAYPTTRFFDSAAEGKSQTRAPQM